MASQRAAERGAGRDIDDRFTLADYLARENQVFDEVRTGVEDVVSPAERRSR